MTEGMSTGYRRLLALELLALGGAALAVWLVTWSPLAHLHHELLTAHMVQHMVLSLVAAPLLLLGISAWWLQPSRAHESPARSAIGARPRRPTSLQLWRPVWRPLRAFGRGLNHPIVCWSAAMLVLIGWHVPSIFNRAHHSESWHLLEQASFLGSGLLFWWPVIQPGPPKQSAALGWEPSPSTARWPRWSMPLYLFLATLPCDALSAFLVFSERIVYPAYLSVARQHGVSALQDQELAGALMWLCVTMAYGIPAAVITTRMLSPGVQAVDPGS
jgi:putative membrane protein